MQISSLLRLSTVQHWRSEHVQGARPQRMGLSCKSPTANVVCTVVRRAFGGLMLFNRECQGVTDCFWGDECQVGSCALEEREKPARTDTPTMEGPPTDIRGLCGSSGGKGGTIGA
jgi:hypothetical protein